jgi:hypothetical protein
MINLMLVEPPEEEEQPQEIQKIGSPLPIQHVFKPVTQKF